MGKRAMARTLVGWTLVAGGAAGGVTAQGSPAAATPEMVGPGVVSTDLNETFPAIDPVTGDLWFSTYEGGFDAQTIRFAAAAGAGWAPPGVAPFSGEYGDRAPRFSPDGAHLYFTSTRPLREGEAAGALNLWVVARGGDGSWGDPSPVAAANDGDRDMHAVIAERAIWFASYRPQGMGRADVYRLPLEGGPDQVANPGAPVNDSYGQPDLWVSPDERVMILVVTDGPGGLGGDDLYVARQTEDGWSVPENLGAPINTDEYEYGPSVSPDGRWLYFTSHRGGSGDIYRVALPESVRAGMR